MASGSNPANLWVLLGLGLAGIIILTRKITKKTAKENFGAFIERLQLLPPPQPAPPKAPHPLTSLSFVISDIFDVESLVTGFGHPDWARLHKPASQTSSVVASLVEGGATCIGKTVVDELCYGSTGENAHYGAPTNPASPSRVPGGSASGAAVAVSAKLADFALGLDTVGGVRVPAGYCGVLGFRSSYGAIPDGGMVQVSPSLDSVGWFARDPSVLRRVGHVLLQLAFASQRNPRQIYVADDCFKLQKIPPDRTSQLVVASAEKIFGRQVVKRFSLSDYINSKAPTLKAFQSLASALSLNHRSEFKALHGDWINTEGSNVSPTILKEVNEVIEQQNLQECLRSLRSEMRDAINTLVKDDGVLVLPTCGYLPPRIGGKESTSNEYKTTTRTLLSIASLSGCCQVVIPLGEHEKCPVSVSLLARHGGDRFLLDTAQTMFASLQEQVHYLSDSKVSRGVDSPEYSAEIAKEKGNQAFKEKQWQKAISHYSEAIKLNGKVATYYSNRAAAFLEVGSYVQAESDCSTAIEYDKKNVKAYLRRGTAREMLCYYKDASDDFKYALVLEPTNKRASQSVERLRKVLH